MFERLAALSYQNGYSFQKQFSRIIMLDVLEAQPHISPGISQIFSEQTT